MAFTEDDVVVKQIGDEKWELVEPLIYEGNRDSFLVQGGFRTDLASVPRPVVWLLPRYGRYTKAAILHDYLCEEARVGLFSRSDADGIFRRTMRELGVSFVRRWMMWAAVRVGAGKDLFLRGIGQLLLVLLVALLSLAMVAIPAVVILVALVLFWVIELLFYFALAPFAAREKANRPEFAWKLSS